MSNMTQAARAIGLELEKAQRGIADAERTIENLDRQRNDQGTILGIYRTSEKNLLAALERLGYSEWPPTGPDPEGAS